MVKTRMQYREEYKSFSEYCQKRWNLGERRAYQIITASEVVRDMKLVSGPTTQLRERYAAELRRVPQEERKAVWENVLETSNGKPST